MQSEMTTLLVQIGFGLMLAWIGYWVRRLDQDQDIQNQRIKEVEKDLAQYKANVAVGVTELQSIKELIQAHIDREETQTWQLIRDIDRKNAEDHTQLFQGLSGVKASLEAFLPIMQAALKR